MIWSWPERQPAEAPALRFEGRVTRYGALATETRAAAAMLAAQGVRRGDRVAFLGANHPAQLVLLFACARLGAMLLPMNWRLAAPELAFILADAEPRLLLATREFLPAARALRADALDAEAGWGEAPEQAAAGTADDAVLLVYTSGTTGRPKGAVLDQRALHCNALNSIDMHGLSAADRVLTILPLFHVGGLNIQTTPALSVGAEVLLHPRFEPAAFFAACAEDRPTLSLVVPAVMQALIAHPGWARADLSSLRAVGAGSSDLPLPLIKAFHARGVPVQNVYGATETAPIAIYQSREEALAAPGAMGRPGLHVEAKLSPQGEILVRGPNTLRRYWRSEAPALDADGWFATGDVGRVDEAGRWWFTDRLKHVIISGGENIYPAEVERVLREAPGVLEGAVCGRPDPRWGEVPVAVVVPGPGFSREAVLAHFQGQLARFKQPHDVIAVPALPRTALGKVELVALRKLVAGS
jgi:fatty-acyl-CoA synthase